MAGRFRRIYRRTQLHPHPSNPSLYARLRYLDRIMHQHPELIVEADEAQLARISELVDGVLDDLACNDYISAELELERAAQPLGVIKDV